MRTRAQWGRVLIVTPPDATAVVRTFGRRRSAAQACERRLELLPARKRCTGVLAPSGSASTHFRPEPADRENPPSLRNLPIACCPDPGIIALSGRMGWRRNCFDDEREMTYGSTVGITITSGMPRSGDNPVSFVVSSNANTDARVGTITVLDRVVLITQAGK